MLSYSEAHEQAEWVLYKLEKSHLTYDDRKRPYFIEDPKVKTKSADWRNYKGSLEIEGFLNKLIMKLFTLVIFHLRKMILMQEFGIG